MANFSEFDYSKGIITQYYKNTETNECITKSKSETQVVHPTKGIVEFLEEPSEATRVVLKYGSTTLSEVRNKSDIQSIYQYYVDYETSKAYFHRDMFGKTITSSYMSIGGTMISYGKIFVEIDDEGNIVSTLKTIIDEGWKAIQCLRELGTSADIYKALKTENVLGTNNINNLKTQNSTATTNINNLKTQNSTASTNISSLTTQNSTATTNINNLKTQNSTASTNIANINSAKTSALSDISTAKTSAIKEINNLGASTEDIASLKDTVSKISYLEYFEGDFLGSMENVTDSNFVETPLHQHLKTGDEIFTAFERQNYPYPLQGAFTKNLGRVIYPIGSVIFTTSNSNPSSIWGGTWVQSAQGMFIVGVGTGKDKNNTSKTFSAGAPTTQDGEYSHTLTVSEMPQHTHEISLAEEGSDYLGGIAQSTTDGVESRTFETDSAGVNARHNNTPPYFGMYCWVKTAM